MKTFFKGLVHFQIKMYSPPCLVRCLCISFYIRIEIKVFDENIPQIISIWYTSMDSKQKIAVSVQLHKGYLAKQSVI